MKPSERIGEIVKSRISREEESGTRKPYDRVTAADIVTFLDEQAQPPSAGGATGDALDGGANCHHCGHFELSAKRARDNYAHCPCCGRHTVWEPPSAGGSGALEMTLAELDDIKSPYAERLRAALEAERQKHASVFAAALAGLTAEQRARKETQSRFDDAEREWLELRAQLQRELDARETERQRMSNEYHTERTRADRDAKRLQFTEEHLAQLQRDLAERTRERDEALNNYRFMVEKAADQKLDGYRELGSRVAKAENERDELLRAVGISAGSNHEGAMAQLRDMRVSLDDAKREPTGETLIGPGARTGPILSRCDSPDCIAPAMHEVCNNGQHVAHFCDSHWLLLDAHLGDIAALVKDGCRPEIAAARVESGTADPGSNDDPLVILREMLHDGWDDAALRELRNVIALLRNERINHDSIASGLHRELEAAECERDAARRERDEARAELDAKLTAIRITLTNAGVPEVEDYPEDQSVDDHERSLRTGGRSLGYVERIERVVADRDRLQAELDVVTRERNDALAAQVRDTLIPLLNRFVATGSLAVLAGKGE